MSHYSCPECSGSTSVIETRVSTKGLRRRRQCEAGHRFTTVELPHNTGRRITDLIKWLTRHLDPEIADYAAEEAQAISLGVASPNDEKDPPDESFDRLEAVPA